MAGAVLELQVHEVHEHVRGGPAKRAVEKDLPVISVATGELKLQVNRTSEFSLTFSGSMKNPLVGKMSKS